MRQLLPSCCYPLIGPSFGNPAVDSNTLNVSRDLVEARAQGCAGACAEAALTGVKAYRGHRCPGTGTGAATLSPDFRSKLCALDDTKNMACLLEPSAFPVDALAMAASALSWNQATLPRFAPEG